MVTKDLVDLANQKNNKQLSHISSLAGIHQYSLLYDFFKKNVPKNSKVLDWGADSGHFSYFLCKEGYQTTGFSMSLFTFKSWVKGYPYKFVQGKDSEPIKLPFKDNSFDVVVSVGVLEHVHEIGGNENDSLKEIYRILKPKGTFICYHLPNKYSLIEFCGQAVNKFHHTNRFTKKDIIELSNKNKFSLMQIKRYGFLPRNSLSQLPNSLKYSTVFANLWDTMDNILGTIFSPFCQNYFFVVQKGLTKK